MLESVVSDYATQTQNSFSCHLKTVSQELMNAELLLPSSDFSWFGPEANRNLLSGSAAEKEQFQKEDRKSL